MEMYINAQCNLSPDLRLAGWLQLQYYGLRPIHRAFLKKSSRAHCLLWLLLTLLLDFALQSFSLRLIVPSLGSLTPVDIVAECIRVALTCAWTDSTDGFGMDPTTCSRHARCGLPHIYARDSCVGQWLQQTCNNNRREENPWQATCT